MKVQDVMSRSVATCRAEDSLHAAAQTMWDRDIGALVVVGNDGRPLAMITDRDICMAAYTTGRPLHELRVASAMSRQLATCRNIEDTTACATRMAKHSVRRLPVLDAAGTLVGIVSLGDLAVAASEPATDAHLTHADTVRAMAAITAPRATSSSTEVAPLISLAATSAAKPPHVPLVVLKAKERSVGDSSRPAP